MTSKALPRLELELERNGDWSIVCGHCLRCLANGDRDSSIVDTGTATRLAAAHWCKERD